MENQANPLGALELSREELTHDVSALAESAKVKLGEAIEPAKEKAAEFTEQQKDVGAEQMRTLARAVHGAAGQLETDMPQFARYIHDAGHYLERTASDLSNNSAKDLLDKVGKFASNQPAAMFGGAVIAGFALTRFLKSSAHHTGQGAPAPGGSS